MWQRGWVCTTNQSLDFDRVLYKLRGEEKVCGNNSYPEILMNTRFQAFQPRWVCRKTNKTITTNSGPWQGSSKTWGVPCSIKTNLILDRDTHTPSMDRATVRDGRKQHIRILHMFKDQLLVCFWIWLMLITSFQGITKSYPILRNTDVWRRIYHYLISLLSLSMSYLNFLLKRKMFF